MRDAKDTATLPSEHMAHSQAQIFTGAEKCCNIVLREFSHENIQHLKKSLVVICIHNEWTSFHRVVGFEVLPEFCLGYLIQSRDKIIAMCILIPSGKYVSAIFICT